MLPGLISECSIWIGAVKTVRDYHTYHGHLKAGVTVAPGHGQMCVEFSDRSAD